LRLQAFFGRIHRWPLHQEHLTAKVAKNRR
jgi:hypothetical protein